MSRKQFLAVCIVFSASLIAAETMVVSPLIVYDEDNNRLEQEQNPSEGLFSAISSHWFEGLLDFLYLDVSRYGEIYTALDANRLCAAENVSYALFGYIQKKNSYWFGNVKMYDYRAKKVVKEWFSSDELAKYERFLERLSQSIVNGIEEVTGLSKGDAMADGIRPFEMTLPVSFFYWTPLDTKWSSALFGIAGGKIGLEIYLPLPEIVLKSVLLDFSVRLDFGYAYAREADGMYPLQYNAFSVMLPLCAHFHFNKKNALYLGAGAYYEVELLYVTPKYESRQFYYQKILGLEGFVGYEIRTGGVMNFFAEVCVDCHLNGDEFIAIKPTVGFSCNLYRSKR